MRPAICNDEKQSVSLSVVVVMKERGRECQWKLCQCASVAGVVDVVDDSVNNRKNEKIS